VPLSFEVRKYVKEGVYFHKTVPFYGKYYRKRIWINVLVYEGKGE